jgi:MFS transporter, MHS family, shikimate and dehydroshikimate transport protein
MSNVAPGEWEQAHSSSVQALDRDISPKDVRRAVTAATVGTLIEWFDYALYGAAAGLVINKLYFPQFSEAGGVLAAFATFAVGFFARPLGGVLLSHMGDKVGRKPALILSIALMGIATVGFGLLPTYAQIGIWAPILLVLFRLIQGFGAGAELAGAITLVAEYAPADKRAFYTAIPGAAPVAGIALATLCFYGVSLLPEEDLLGWAWRVPFLLSGVLFVVALYIRRRLDETPAYVAAMDKAQQRKTEESVPLKLLLKNSPRELILGCLSVTGHNANAYILSAFALSYMTNTLAMSRADSLLVMTVSCLVAVVTTPAMGALADKWGHGKVFALGAAFAILYAYPFFALLGMKTVGTSIIAMSLGYGIAFSAMAGAQGAFLTNLFPTRYRFSGLTIARELNGVVIAGPTPFIAAYLVSVSGGQPTYVALFVMACCAVTVLAVALGNRLSYARD